MLMAVAQPMNYIFNTYVVPITERNNADADYDDYYVI